MLGTIALYALAAAMAVSIIVAWLRGRRLEASWQRLGVARRAVDERARELDERAFELEIAEEHLDRRERRLDYRERMQFAWEEQLALLEQTDLDDRP
jgi:hypothetical protein